MELGDLYKMIRKTLEIIKNIFEIVTFIIGAAFIVCCSYIILLAIKGYIH